MPQPHRGRSPRRLVHRPLAVAAAALAGMLAACGSDGNGAPAAGSAGETSAPEASNALLTIGFGFEDVIDPTTDWEAINARLDEVGAKGVTLAVGRPEWVAFPWEGHEEVWASGVTSGTDLVADAVAAIGTAPDGSARYITLVVDTLAPATIAAEPDLAAVDHDRNTSESFPGAAALEGTIGDNVVALVAAAAERYEPDVIALTELIVESTYSDADFEAFVADTGADPEDGWPDHNGEELGAWRSSVVANLSERATEAAHEFGVELDVDVRTNWDVPGGDRLESGHDYELLLQSADRLTVWNYFPLNDREPSYSAEITAGLADRFSQSELDRITMSVGLWISGSDMGATTDSALAPDAMAEAVRESATNGITSVSVTPHSMMTDAHWEALAALNQ